MSKATDPADLPPTVLCRRCKQHLPARVLNEEEETAETLDSNNTVECKKCRI